MEGDEERIRQIFWNLLSNAIKFTHQGGQIEVSLEREGPYARVDVKDNGEGIAYEFQPHIFERFWQADSSLTRKHDGLGLGLAIVQDLVEAHFGKVTFKSDGIGKGAIFTVKLPFSTIS